jgi:predicted O-methyltransferase YrrM
MAMRSFAHWTPRYVFDRSLNLLSDLIHPEWPWLTPAAVRFLETRLKPADLVFEWGAGRSTLWTARRVKRVISVEHDPAWFRRIRSRATRRGLGNLEIKLVEDAQRPDCAIRYVEAIYEFEEKFDVISVDGLHRERCALAALEKIKPGGMVLLDNANWYLPSSSRAPASRSRHQGASSSEWAEFQRQVSGWQVLWTSNGVTDTAIWFSPGCKCDGIFKSVIILPSPPSGDRSLRGEPEA